MALPASGEISMAQIQTEFGGTDPISLSEYYGVAAGIPASGAISLSDFYGTGLALYTPMTIDNPNTYGTASGDNFGNSVATSPTYTIIGASSEDDAGGLSSGKAYIFLNSTAALLHTLDNPNHYGTSASDYFGRVVDCSEKYSLVSAWEQSAEGIYVGVAYVFDNATGALLHTLENPNAYGTDAWDFFGSAVACTDTHAVIGAYSEGDASGTKSGKAYIFNIVTGALLYTLDNPNPYGTSLNDFFGYSVDCTDTYTIVGALYEDETDNTDSGKAYIFLNSTGALHKTLDNPNAFGTSGSDFFGNAVACSELYSVVGAFREDGVIDYTDAGKAYIFLNSTGALLHTLENPEPYGTRYRSYFGFSVDCTDNYTIVGASEEDEVGNTKSGKVFIFNSATGELLSTLNNPNAYGTSKDDRFGYSVSCTDTHAIIGTFQEDEAGGTGSGKAYIYSLIG